MASNSNPSEYIHSDRVALSKVLSKVHPRPEPLYVPIEVNTRQVDGLARIPGPTQAPHRRILSHRIAFRNLSHLIPLSTNTQDSLVASVRTLKEVRVKEGKWAILVVRKSGLPPTKRKDTKQNYTRIHTCAHSQKFQSVFVLNCQNSGKWTRPRSWRQTKTWY